MVDKIRLFAFLVSFIVTIIITRLYLYFNPTSNLYVAGYNIHHLYTGLLLIIVSAIPLMIFSGHSLYLTLAAIVFGLGLALAVDQWVYLITTDGSDMAYLYPISFWGAVIMGLLVVGYSLIWLLLD